VMHKLAWVTDTSQEPKHKHALRALIRPSYSYSHASSEASGSSAGVMVRRVAATRLSASGAV